MLHICASLGNFTVLEWYYEKKEKANDPGTKVPEWLDIKSENAEDLTPLFLACLYGKPKSAVLENEETTEIQENRLKCVKILVDNGDNVNFKTEKLSMTPLHWAAFNGDTHVVKHLLNEGAL